MMVTKPVGQAEFERVLMSVPGPQGELLPGQRAPGVSYTGKAGRPKGRRNNKTLMKLANLDNIGEVMLRQRAETAMCDPIDEAERMVRRIYKLEPDAALTEAQRDLVAHYALEMTKIREKARDGIQPFISKKKPTEIDISEKKITEVRFITENRNQLPGGVRGMVVEGTAEVIAGGDKT